MNYICFPFYSPSIARAFKSHDVCALHGILDDVVTFTGEAMVSEEGGCVGSEKAETMTAVLEWMLVRARGLTRASML